MDSRADTMPSRKAIIIGAGPAGLTAAYELLTRTDIKPIVVEKSEHMGGLSRTVNYKGNRIDIGGHRFFSKSDRVMEWWLTILPLEQSARGTRNRITYQRSSRSIAISGDGPDPQVEDKVMLLRKRRSRIYFMRRFFKYPISLSLDTLSKLGPGNTLLIGFSYLKAAMFPIKNEVNLEQFFINRFGRRLYETFFRSYTEKVWGVPCAQISASWGAQRIKGLSIKKTITHAFKKLMPENADIKQKKIETSLIEQFLYPKFGPGQMWQEVARQVQELGGEIHTGLEITKLRTSEKQVVAIEAADSSTGRKETFSGDYFFSTMPIKDLISALDQPVPPDIREISDGLIYRDFITVGLLLNDLIVRDPDQQEKLIADNWIYIQEPGAKMARLQVFNNWSPYMVADANKVWLGVEYMCNETDGIWNLPDDKVVELAISELEQLGIAKRDALIDAVVIRMPKTYPAYFGTYNRFSELRTYLDQFENLFLIGRNGQHKYNNQDHSMLSAMTAVDNLVAGINTKENVWAVNTEADYQESD